MRPVRNVGQVPVEVPIPLKTNLLTKPLHELLKLKKDVKIHTVPPGALLVYDETEVNGQVVTDICQQLGLIYVPEPLS